MDAAAAWFLDLFGQCTKEPSTGDDFQVDGMQVMQKKGKKEKKAKKEKDANNQQKVCEPGAPAHVGDACEGSALAGNGDGKGARYVIDNSVLQINVKGHPGVAFRYSKSEADKVRSGPLPAKWGATVEGIDEGDGWLKVGSLYLPMLYKGVPIVKLVSEAESKPEQLTTQSIKEPVPAEATPQAEVPVQQDGDKLEREPEQHLQDLQQDVEDVQLVRCAEEKYRDDENLESVEDVYDAKELLQDQEFRDWVQAELLPNKQEF